MIREVWFVIGTSSGFGLATVQEGYKVAAATRSLAKLRAAPGADVNDSLLPLEVDLTSADSKRSPPSRTPPARSRQAARG
jgi:NADP-dependent 3-hydroxy acid dehydrogenase YdfG